MKHIVLNHVVYDTCVKFVADANAFILRNWQFFELYDKVIVSRGTRIMKIWLHEGTVKHSSKFRC